MSQDKIFPNGFRSWMETHHEVVDIITYALSQAKTTTPILLMIQETEGRCGFYDFAEQITDEFEAANKDREWDGEFLEAIDSFTRTKLNL